MNNSFLQAAISIGDQLVSLAERDEHGLSWATQSVNSDQEVIWSKSETIYSGCSGIVLFLLALYGQTNDKKYLAAAEQGGRWVAWYCREHPVGHYSLITGRLGAAFMLLKLYEVTGRKTYLTKALHIAKSSGDFLKAPGVISEFINGLGSATVGLLHLYAASPEPWLLELLGKYTQTLMQHAHYGKTGLYWDSNRYEVRPLCGFSHGSAGIGFVFLELGHYFKNPAFYFVAEQAFAYENYYYNRARKNWPDFRLDIWTEDKAKNFDKAYEMGNLDVFTQASDMNAWCHGAAGIGLSRLRAYELGLGSRYLQDAKRAITKTKRDQAYYSFALCHGGGGNAELFIEAHLALKNEQYLKDVSRVASATLKQKKAAGKYASGLRGTDEDPSFFNGTAGIGYFLLRVHNPKGVPSILAPRVESTIKSQQLLPGPLGIQLPELRKALLKNIFPRTLEILQSHASKQLAQFFGQKDAARDKDLFIQFAKKMLAELPAEAAQKLKDNFSLELQKLQMNEAKTSNALLYVQARHDKKIADKLLSKSDANFLKVNLALCAEAALISTKAGGSLLLKTTPEGVDELAISQFCEVVLKQFREPKIVKAAIAAITALYNPQNEADTALIKQKVLEQIREALKYDILSLH